jgi:hypothetical protein
MIGRKLRKTSPRDANPRKVDVTTEIEFGRRLARGSWGGNPMTGGRVLAIFVVLLGLLVLVGITDNASISHDDERRLAEERSPARAVI